MASILALVALGLLFINTVESTQYTQPPIARRRLGPASIGADWRHLGNSTSSSRIEFTFVLEGDYDGLTTRMEQIATEHLSWLNADELAAYVMPSDDAIAAVESAINELGATRVSTSAAGDKVTVSTTIEKASKYFSAEFNQYQFTRNGQKAHKTLSYTIPPSISHHVTDIYPISTFGSYRSFTIVDPETVNSAPGQKQDMHRRTAPSMCTTSSTTSLCYRTLYGYTNYTPIAASSTPNVGIMAYVAQNYAPADLAKWMGLYRTDANASTYSITVNVSNGAGNFPITPGVEAALDTQTVTGIIYPLPSTFYDVGTVVSTGDLFLLTFQNFLDMTSGRPPVISISYGSDESDFTSAQATTMCNAAQQLSALGTTIVVSSGDNGVDGQGDVSCPKFQPTYPSGCPYILSVGATQSFSPEVMANKTLAGFYSGSGFSNYFKAPSYQSSFTAAYVNTFNELDSANYNAAGRAFPDVSAQGSLQPIVQDGYVRKVGGTSASAPIVAGGLGLLNNLLIAAGKPTTGWINPTLYKNPSAFTDITSGGAYGCNGTQGFPAKSGWDAAAGLGTPQFSGLRALYGV